jgi:hypothetical protein
VLRTSANALWVSPLTFVVASTPGTGGFIDIANQRIEIQHNQPIKTAQDLAKVTIQGAEDPACVSVTSPPSSRTTSCSSVTRSSTTPPA